MQKGATKNEVENRFAAICWWYYIMFGCVYLQGLSPVFIALVMLHCVCVFPPAMHYQPYICARVCSLYNVSTTTVLRLCYVCATSVLRLSYVCAAPAPRLCYVCATSNLRMPNV